MVKRILISAFILASSAAQANIVVDKTDIDEKDYIYDLHQCTELSEQAQKQQVQGGAVSGAAKGAAVGAAAGAISGGSGSSGAQTGAAIGVVGGALSRRRANIDSEAQYQNEKDTILRNCMTNRGYIILN